MMICLNMIVKNEAAQISATLESVMEKAPISAWCIHDTGSSDGTPEMIQHFFDRRGIEGELVHQAWENFGANRQYALRDAEQMAEWILIIDADDALSGDVLDLSSVPNDATAISLPTRRGSTHYRTTRLIRGDVRYSWRGVVHEGLYFKGPGRERVVNLENTTLLSERGGARSRDAATYYRDATALCKAIAEIDAGLSKDADLLPRYIFYAANSWRDAGAPREAAELYRRRIALGGWVDEVYLSWLGLGIELSKTGDQKGAIEAWVCGHEMCPERAECAYHIAKLQRERGMVHMALAYAEKAAALTRAPHGRLFVWADVYKFWALFELGMCLAKARPVDDRITGIIARMREVGAPEHLMGIIARCSGSSEKANIA